MDAFPRRLLDVLFDGNPEADDALAAAAKASREWIAALRKLSTIPPAPSEIARLALRYRNGTPSAMPLLRHGTGRSRLLRWTPWLSLLTPKAGSCERMDWLPHVARLTGF